MASAKISCFETASNHDRNFMSSGEPRISVTGFSLAAMTRRVHSTKRTPSSSCGLGARADHEALRHRADAETGHLRKDEPHRVSLFSSAREFLDDLPVDSGLRVHEAPQVALQAGRGTAFIG
jgi:hypothetical protein